MPLPSRCPAPRAVLKAAAMLAASLPAILPIAAQTSAAPTYKVSVRLVTLDVVVTDKKGNLVTNLSKEDFALYEDGQPQTVKTFEPPSAHLMPTAPDGKRIAVVNSSADLPKIGNAPVTILVLDELNTGFTDMAYARQSMQKYLMAQPEVLNQPTALLVAGNTRFQLLEDYTQNRAALLAALKRHFPEYPWKMANSGKSGPGAVERIVQSLSSLLQIAEASRGTSGRKNVIWVGVNAPGVNLSSADPVTVQQMDAVVKRVTQTLLATRVTLYSIDPTINSSATVGVMVPGDTDDSDTFVDTDPFGADVNFNEFAPATGGKIFFSRNDIDNEIATSIDNGNSYYTLSYTPTNKSEDAAKFRNIKIKLSNPNLIATTRLGYYPEAENANNMQADTTLDPKQRKDALVMEMSEAALSTLPYNGLAVTARRNPDKKTWTIAVPGPSLSWTPGNPGTYFTEVTAMMVAFDERGSEGHGKYKPEGKSRMLSHVSRELQAGRKDGAPIPASVPFQLEAPVPAGASRIRFIVRDAVTGKIGTVDLKP